MSAALTITDPCFFMVVALTQPEKEFSHICSSRGEAGRVAADNGETLTFTEFCMRASLEAAHFFFLTLSDSRNSP